MEGVCHADHKDAKRPADDIGAAVQVARIAAGEEETQPVLRSAQELEQKGGQARARELTPTQRQSIARQGAEARWAAKGNA